MDITEVKTGGLGGQGIILAGMIIGKAASIHEDKHATLTQSFGPEARGSACGASIVVSDEPVEYPYVTRPDILVVMSQEACNRFAPEMAPNGILLYEADLVEPTNLPGGVRAYGIPATRIAEELQRKMVANITMVETLGDSTILRLQTKNETDTTQITCKTPGRADVHAGDNVTLHVAAERALFFDIESGVNVFAATQP